MRGRHIKILLWPFLWLFSMPPVENRPEIKNFLRYFIYMNYDRRYNEAYVYYKTFMVNLWLNGFFIIMYYISFVSKRTINLRLFTIAYRHGAPVDELVYGYPLHVFPILVIVTVLHSITLFMLQTDYLSKERIIHDKEPILHNNKRLYDIRPPVFMLTILFLVTTGFMLWGIAHYFRSYKMYNYLHDFRAPNLPNFLIYATTYFIFYQTLYCQMFVMTSVNLIRSILHHYVYRKEANQLIKKTDSDDDK